MEYYSIKEELSKRIEDNIAQMTIIAGIPALCVWLIYKFLLKEDKKESSKNGK